MKTLDICEKMLRLNENCKSNICGRRNWTVRIQKSRTTGEYGIFFAGGFGDANRRGVLGCMLKTLVELDISWFHFTYKKDFVNCLTALKALGVNGYSYYERYGIK